MTHLVGCCACVCCVLCFVLQPTTRRLYLFFQFVIFSSFVIIGVRILTGQTVIWDLFQPSARRLYFFFLVVIFSGCNLNPLKNIAGQTTVPFFPVVIFSGRMYNNWCLCQITNTNYNQKKLRPEKKVQSSGRLCFSTHRKKLRPEKKVQSSDQRLK